MITSTILVVALCLGLVALPAQDAVVRIEEKPYRYVRQNNGPILSLEIAPPILPHRFRSLVEKLELADDQADWVEQLYQEYLRDDRSLRERELSPLMATAESLGMLSGPQDPAVHDSLRRSTAQVRRETSALEDHLFAQIAQVVTGQQAADLALLREHRGRVRLGHLSNTPGAQLDLTLLVLAHRDSDRHWNELNPQQVQADLAAYSASLTGLYRHNRTARDRELSKALAARERFLAAQTPEQSAEAQRLLGELAMPGIAIARQARQLQTRTLGQLSLSLDETSTSSLRSDVMEIMFPPVYPDPFDPLGFLADEAGVGAEDPLLVRFEHEYKGVGEAMEREYVRWEESLRTSGGYGEDDVHRYVSRMRELLSRRVALATSVVEVFGLKEELPNLPDDYEANVVGTATAQRYLGDGWPLYRNTYHESRPPNSGRAEGE